MSPFFPVLSCS